MVTGMRQLAGVIALTCLLAASSTASGAVQSAPTYKGTLNTICRSYTPVFGEIGRRLVKEKVSQGKAFRWDYVNLIDLHLTLHEQMYAIPIPSLLQQRRISPIFTLSRRFDRLWHVLVADSHNQVRFQADYLSISHFDSLHVKQLNRALDAEGLRSCELHQV